MGIHGRLVAFDDGGVLSADVVELLETPDQRSVGTAWAVPGILRTPAEDRSASIEEPHRST